MPLSVVNRFLQERLSRVSVSTRFVPEIDGLRFIAISSVVFYHLLGIISVRQYGRWDPALFAGTWPLNWIIQGHFGVPLFFVISGFVLAMPFAEHHLFQRKLFPLRSYYLRRVTRLEPTYLLNLLFVFCFLIATGHLAWRDWPHLVASAFYIHNLTYGSMSTVNAVAWTLEVEIQFYLVAPFLALLFCIKGNRVRRLVIIALMLLSALAVEYFMPAVGDRWNGNLWRRLLLNYTQYFLAGFLLVDFYLCNWREKSPSSRTLWWDLTGMAAWIFIWSSISGGSICQVLLPFAVFFAYAAAFRGRWWNRFFCLRAIFLIGGMCYTLYLWHQLILMVWGKYGLPGTWCSDAPLPMNVAIQFALGGLLVVGLGAPLFIVMERPFMRKDWYRRWFHGRSEAAVPVVNVLVGGHAKNPLRPAAK